MSSAGLNAPAKGTRPPNRRKLILDAASDLFCERGFSRVAMGDIAAVVAVGPSALYRHFPGKQRLLVEVLLVRLEAFGSGIAEAAHADEPMVALARTSVEYRDFGLLWEREARQIGDAGRREVAHGIYTLVDAIQGIIGPMRPGLPPQDVELLAWATIGVMVSPSFHHVELPGDRLPRLLADMSTTAISLPLELGDQGPSRDSERHEAPTQSRRGELLNAAIGLFAANGFHSVGIEDIAAAVGLTGTSIYRHFETKNELLVEAIQRGNERLRVDLNRAVTRSPTPDAAIRKLVASYVGLVLEHPDLVTVLISEIANLSDDDRRRIQKEQHNYIAEWLHLLGGVHADEPTSVARVRVQAALTIVNTCGRSHRLRQRAGLSEVLQKAAEAALGLHQQRS